MGVFLMLGYDIYQNDAVNMFATTQLQKIANAEYDGIGIIETLYKDLRGVYDATRINVKEIYIKVNKRKKVQDVYDDVVSRVNSAVEDAGVRRFIINVKKVSNGIVIKAKR